MISVGVYCQNLTDSRRGIELIRGVPKTVIVRKMILHPPLERYGILASSEYENVSSKKMQVMAKS